tara:strand:- start:210 stop:617 length:408 start_codon:yes stop_codon:yes gene_type:complete
MMTIPIRFIANPSETKVLAENAPVEKITILGGVATGNMNAQDALMAAGTISNLGSIAAPIAAAAMIGINIVVVAVLLVTSVKKVTQKQIVAMISKIGRSAISSNAEPMMELRPELVNAWAMDNPAPNKIRVPQGI